MKTLAPQTSCAAGLATAERTKEEQTIENIMNTRAVHRNATRHPAPQRKAVRSHASQVNVYNSRRVGKRTHSGRTQKRTIEGHAMARATDERTNERTSDTRGGRWRRSNSAFTPHHTMCVCGSERERKLANGSGGTGSDGGWYGHGQKVSLTVLYVAIG